MRWLVVLAILTVGVLAGFQGVNPVALALGAGALVVVALVVRPPRIEDRGEDAFRRELSARPDPPAPRLDRNLRPVARLTSDDPLSPLYGQQTAFPPDPDQGLPAEHHVMIDPRTLGGPGEGRGEGR